jgi:hypothetical protein
LGQSRHCICFTERFCQRKQQCQCGEWQVCSKAKGEDWGSKVKDANDGEKKYPGKKPVRVLFFPFMFSPSLTLLLLAI